MMNRAIFSGGVHSWVGPRWSSACPFNRDSITRRKDKIVYSGTLGEGYVSLILDVCPAVRCPLRNNTVFRPRREGCERRA